MKKIRELWDKARNWFRNRNKAEKCIIIILAAVLVLSALGAIVNPDGFISSTQSTRSSSTSPKAAWACAQKYVKDQLIAPATAQFCSYWEATIAELGDNKYRVSGWVDAQNSFGAMIRTNFTMTLTITYDGFLNDEYVVSSFTWS